MAVTVKMSDIEFARINFEQFVMRLGYRLERDVNGTSYVSRTVDNWWVFYQMAFKQGRESAGGQCEF